MQNNSRIVSPPNEEMERIKFYKEYIAHPDDISDICKNLF